MNYVVCPRCGAHLDCGERCDCEKEQQLEPAQTLKNNEQQAQSVFCSSYAMAR